MNTLYDLPKLAELVRQPIGNKEDLFFKYSKNLELVAEILYEDKIDQFRGKYICPLCWEVFFIEDLDALSENPLTIEHIPPQSVGWKRKVLTCKKCNNTQGSQLDSHIPQILNTIAFNKKIPGTSVNCKFKIGQNIVSGIASIKGDGSVKLHLDEKRSNPVDFKNIKQALEKGTLPEIQLNWKTGEQKRALISMIRSAYLWGFSDFGYAFIYNQNLNLVREQILNPEKDLYFEKYVLSGSFPEEWEGFNIIEQPEQAEGYAFILNLKAFGVNDEICVLLPAPDKRGKERLRVLKDLISKEKPELSFNGLSDPEALHHPENCIQILAYWLHKYP